MLEQGPRLSHGAVGNRQRHAGRDSRRQRSSSAPSVRTMNFATCFACTAACRSAKCGAVRLTRWSLLTVGTALLSTCGGSGMCACPNRPVPAPALGLTSQKPLTFNAIGVAAQVTVTILLPPQQTSAPKESDNCTQGPTSVVGVSSPTPPQHHTSTVVVTPLVNGSCLLSFSGDPGVLSISAPVSVAAP